jgi:hypothetical protein
MEEKLASEQLEVFNTKLKDLMNQEIIKSNLTTEIRQALQQGLDTIKNNEIYYINTSQNNFIIVFGALCLGIITLIITYYYVCKYIINVKVEWISIFISLFFIVICIIGFQILYFVNILMKKRINDKKILKYFINEMSLA